MHILIDNTGFHSAGRCLDKAGLGPVDIKGLLQFALEIIFSEEILISGFESYGILGRTEEIAEKLRSEGLEREAVQVRTYSTEYYAKACEEGAARLASDFDYTFTTQTLNDSVDLRAARPDLLPHELSVEKRVHDLIKRDRTEQELEEIAEASLQEKAAGSMAYMLSRCLPLWEKVRIAATSDSWTPKTTEQLIAALRYYMNDSLAQNESAYYTPAVARAEMLRSSNKAVTAAVAVSSIVADAVEKFKPKSLGLPSVSNVLVQKAKGDPTGVIAEAIRLRAMVTDLRKYLAEKLSTFDMNTPDWHHALHVQVKDLAWALERELHLTKQPQILDAVEIQLSPLPFSISLKSLKDWNRFRKLRKYVVVLTELSKELAFGQIDRYALDKLTAASVKDLNLTRE